VPRHWRWLAASLVALVALFHGARAVAAKPTRAIVFATPVSPGLEAALRDALTAQLSGSDAEVVFERIATEGAPLRTQVSEARSLASAHDAVGVFWLDSARAGDWLLYLAEPAGERVLVRRLPFDSKNLDAGAVAAAVEAVAVITRQSTDALLAGQTIGMQPVDVPSAPVTGTQPNDTPARLRLPPRPPVADRHFSLSIGYYGDSTATSAGWQGGASLGGAYRFDNGLFVGATYVAFRELSVEATDVAFRITRTPIQAQFGAAFGHRRVVPAVELRGIVEVLDRVVVSADPALEPTPASTRVVLFLAPRFRLECKLTPGLRLYFAGGVDVAMNRFSFVSRIDGTERPLLEQRLLRPAGELGFSVWP
jgi:hypothetical protein